MSENAPLMLSVSGLRGIVGKSLTPEVAVRYAAAVGTFLMDRAGSPEPRWDAKAAQRANGPKRVRVVLAYDGRVGGDVVRDAASAGLKAVGCDVIHAGATMTPSLAVGVDHAGADAGVMITASHNPQEWNGLKVILRERGARSGRTDACAPPKAIAERIIERFRTGAPAMRPWDGLGQDLKLAGPLLVHGHRDVVTKLLDELGVRRSLKRRRFRTVLDSVNGAGGTLATWLLEDDCGCHLTRLGAETPAPFWHTPEPIAENLGAVCRTVKKHKAAVGFCQDPDGDRLALIDERGRFIGEEYTLVLTAMALAEFGLIKKGSKLAVNLSTSRMIEDVAAARGARVIRTAVGEANVVEAMKREKCVLGGEGNGGVIGPRVTYVRDSLSGMALVLALMARTGKSVSELVADVPSYTIMKKKVELKSRDQAADAVEKIAKAYASRGVDRQDGAWVGFPDDRAWLHVRASNTEPIMRLIAEAPTNEKAHGLVAEAERFIGG